jgi:hypothetical protein
MDETQTLAVLALRELLDNPERDDWDELLAANRALIKVIETGEPMTRRIREAGWREHAIGAVTTQAGATGYARFIFARPDKGRSRRMAALNCEIAKRSGF